MVFLESCLKASQKTLISPKIEQSLKILQMNSVDLMKHLELISMENPFLDLQEDKEYLFDEKSLDTKIEWLKQCDEENKYLYQSGFNDKEPFSGIMKEYSSLETILLNQINTAKISSEELKIGKYIVQCLDTNGYLNIKTEEIAAKLSVRHDFVERVLTNLIQAMEPWGMGARSLSECLVIQLERKGLCDDNLKKIVYNDLALIAENKLSTLAKKYNISINETVNYCTLIKSLNPKPGSSLNEENIGFITPDIIVNQKGDTFEIELNNTTTPKIFINHSYKNELLEKNDTFVSEYVKRKVRQAIWVHKCVIQRKETLLKIGKSIVRNQIDFFKHGPGNLNSMVLSDIANELSIHESTVSRAVSDKLLQCSWGIFDLKYFFSSSVGEFSSDIIKAKIRKIIDGEDKLKPLSDRKITDIFLEQGIKVSRRTVAKYREEMNIPGTCGRKQFI